jgi:beta-1,4-N-acetylglucosaminyltransferase
MIFVTVGTAGPFDLFLKEVDRLNIEGFFSEDVIFQVGQSGYRPRSGDWFRARSNIDEFYRDASFIFCHGGAGTVLECLLREKRFVAVPNKIVDDDHQTKFLEEIQIYCDISWTDNLTKLYDLYVERKQKDPAGIAVKFPRISTLI